MSTTPCFQVDAFTSRAFRGNPAAVCLLDKSRSAKWMQDVAAEKNLSETAFVTPLKSGFRLQWSGVIPLLLYVARVASLLYLPFRN